MRAADLPDRTFPAPRSVKKRRLPLLIGAGLLAVAIIAGAIVARGNRDPSLNASLARLTSNPQELPIDAFVLSPDGKELAFSDPRGIRIRNIESKEDRHFAVKLADVRHLSWSFAPSSISRLSLHEGSDVTSGWFSDGRVMFVSDRGRNSGPWAQRPGQLEAEFLGPDVGWMARPEIAPDGVGLFGFLVGPELAKGPATATLALRAADGGYQRIREVMPQATLRRDGRSPALKNAIRCGEAPGVGCVLATEKQNGQLCFERLDDAGALVTSLGCVSLPIRSRTWDLSPDGQTIIYVMPDGVGAIPLDTTPLRPRPFAPPDECTAVSACFDRGHMLFSATCLGKPAFLVGAEDGGVVIGHFEGTDPLTSVAVSHDGGHVAFTQRRVDADVYLIEGIAR